MNIAWKPINNFPMYFINTRGDVLSLRSTTPKYMKPHLNNTGYYQVMLFDGEKVVPKCLHKLLAEAFIPNPNKYSEINHKDYNRTNNRVDNLEWITQSQNTRYAFLKGNKSQKGEKNNMAKLTMEKVKEIRKFKEENDHLSQQQIADHFNLKRENVKDIINYKTWNY